LKDARSGTSKTVFANKSDTPDEPLNKITNDPEMVKAAK
jgi:hypothetical protein